MSPKVKTITLPEFAFIDGSEHEQGGNPTEGRTILLHVRTATVIEVFAELEDEFALSPETVTFRSSYRNDVNLSEPFTFAIHYTFSDDPKEVLEKAARWYFDYCRWEDQNIENERKGGSN